MGEPSFIRLSQGSFPGETPCIELPASKSISNRLLIMAKLSGNRVNISNLSTANDTQLLQGALQSTGEMYVGDAGTALRFGLAWAAMSPGSRRISGTDRLHQRPIKSLVEALLSLGANINYLGEAGFAPLLVIGEPLIGGTIEVDGSLSSQFVSAIMLIAPYFQHDCEIHLSAAQVSKPYIALTAHLMQQAGAEIELRESSLRIAAKPYQALSIEVEPDWSAAAFFYAFVALKPGSQILLKGLKLDTAQGDRACVSLFSNFGVRSEFSPDGLLISHDGRFEKIQEFDFSGCPDLAQAAAVAAAGLGIQLNLKGLSTLRHKETDRLAALQSELAKLGVKTTSTQSTLALFTSVLETGITAIQTFEDHRMAMAFAALSAVLPTIEIENSGVVKKSFPTFWDEFGKLGVGQLLNRDLI